MAALAFIVGAAVGSSGGTSPAESLAQSYAHDWTSRQWAAMYAQLDPASRAHLSSASFAANSEEALRTATVTSATVAGSPHPLPEGAVAVPVKVQTRLFGTLMLDLRLPERSVSEAQRIVWSHSILFPGLGAGEELVRHSTMPARAAVLARDGSELAEPTQNTTEASGEETPAGPLGEAGRAVLGRVGPVPASRRAELEAEGVPAHALVGISGLELALDRQLRGTPGGELLAGTRVLASAGARAGTPAQTTVSPAIQRTASTALAGAGALGGVVVLDPSNGQVLAVAGIGLEGLQPPGSTFKMITASGALEAGITTLGTEYPYGTYALLDGVKLHNANGEECGGTLEHSFAVSCNSVFAPLGVKLGAPKLVATAEHFGFNAPTGPAGAATSTIPAASAIQGELDLGSTAIGQGQVQATPLQMALVASTIGEGGMRPAPTFLSGGSPTKTRAISAKVAHEVRRMMIAVVREGTGTAAAIPGVTVAGKTGTAELRSSCKHESTESTESTESSASTQPSETCASETSNTDAWFASFAPALHPRVAVCVMLVEDGAGGATAAPVAHQVLEAALQSKI